MTKGIDCYCSNFLLTLVSPSTVIMSGNSHVLVCLFFFSQKVNSLLTPQLSVKTKKMSIQILTEHVKPLSNTISYNSISWNTLHSVLKHDMIMDDNSKISPSKKKTKHTHQKLWCGLSVLSKRCRWGRKWLEMTGDCRRLGQSGSCGQNQYQMDWIGLYLAREQRYWSHSQHVTV